MIKINTNVFLDTEDIKKILAAIDPVDYPNVIDISLANKLLEYFTGVGLTGKAIMEPPKSNPNSVNREIGYIGTWKCVDTESTAIVFLKTTRIIRATCKPLDMWVGVIFDSNGGVFLGIWELDGRYIQPNFSKFNLMERISERA